MKFRILAAFFCLLLAACGSEPLMFPTNNPLPYSQGEFSGVRIHSSPQDVVNLLGKPPLQLQDGSLWIYGQTRAESTDGLGTYHHDYRAVLIEFSDGRVTSKDLIHGHVKVGLVRDCWSNGLCLEPVWDSRSDDRDEPKILSRRYSVVTSIREDDARAKRFTPDYGLCAVYVYSGRSVFRDIVPPVLSIGTARDEPVPIGGYLHFQSLPQQLQLVAGRNTVDIDCRPGSLYFYRLDKYGLTDEDNIRIRSVGNGEGRKAINKRQLLLTW